MRRMGPNPTRRSPPARRKPSQSLRIVTGDWDDLEVVLAGCTDCRSRRDSPGSPSPPPREGHESSLAHRPRLTPRHGGGVKEAIEAGARRRGRAYGGGLSKSLRSRLEDPRKRGCRQGTCAKTQVGEEVTRSVASSEALRLAGCAAQAANFVAPRQGRGHSSMEGALVPATSLPFDEGGGRGGAWWSPARARPEGRARTWRSRQRASDAELHARWRSTRPRSRGASRRSPRSGVHMERGGPMRRRCEGFGPSVVGVGCGRAEAGGPPSSGALPDGSFDDVSRWRKLRRRSWAGR